MGCCTPRIPNSSTRPIGVNIPDKPLTSGPTSRSEMSDRSSSSASSALVGRGPRVRFPISATRYAHVSTRWVSCVDSRWATTIPPSGGGIFRYRAYGNAAGSQTPIGRACGSPRLIASASPHASGVSTPSSASSVLAAATEDPGPRAVTRSPSTVTLVSASRSASHSAPAAFTSSSTQ